MAQSADAAFSNNVACEGLWVQVPPRAPARSVGRLLPAPAHLHVVAESGMVTALEGTASPGKFLGSTTRTQDPRREPGAFGPTATRTVRGGTQVEATQCPRVNHRAGIRTVSNAHRGERPRAWHGPRGRLGHRREGGWLLGRPVRPGTERRQVRRESVRLREGFAPPSVTTGKNALPTQGGGAVAAAAVLAGSTPGSAPSGVAAARLTEAETAEPRLPTLTRHRHRADGPTGPDRIGPDAAPHASLAQRQSICMVRRGFRVRFSGEARVASRDRIAHLAELGRRARLRPGCP